MKALHAIYMAQQCGRLVKQAMHCLYALPADGMRDRE